MVNWGDPIVLEHGMILKLHFFGIVWYFGLLGILCIDRWDFAIEYPIMEIYIHLY